MSKMKKKKRSESTEVVKRRLRKGKRSRGLSEIKRLEQDPELHTSTKPAAPFTAQNTPLLN